MCSYLVYSSFPLIDVVGAVPLVINLPGASGSKAQMVAPHGTVRATVSVTLEVTQCSQRLLCNLNIVRACSFVGCLLEAAPAEVTALGLLQQRLLAQACFGGGC